MSVSLAYVRFIVPIHLGINGDHASIDLTCDQKVESLSISETGWVSVKFKGQGESFLVSPGSVRVATVKAPAPPPPPVPPPAVTKSYKKRG